MIKKLPILFVGILALLVGGIAVADVADSGTPLAADTGNYYYYVGNIVWEVPDSKTPELSYWTGDFPTQP